MAETKFNKKIVDVEVGTNGLKAVSVRFPSDLQKAAELKRAQENGLEAPKTPLLCSLKLFLENGMSVVGIKYVTSEFAGQVRKDGTVAPKGFIRMPNWKSGNDWIDYVNIPKDMIAEISAVVDAVLEADEATVTEAVAEEVAA